MGSELLLSLVVPCYNEESALKSFVRELQNIIPRLEGFRTEVIFVNDGSQDGTLGVIREICAGYDDFKYISFSRNFGKESAMLAGFEHSRGDYVAVMDADLQDPPALLPKMLRAVREEGYDCAGTMRSTRKGEPVVRSFFASLFYRLINRLSDTKLVNGARDYKLLSRRAVNALLAMPEVNRFSKGLYEWVGFRTKWIEYENVERVAGESKWSFWSLFCYSVEGIVAFTTVPLALASVLGLIITALTIVFIILLCVRQYLWHNSVDGWTSMICIIMLLSGMQMLCVGIIGQYMAKMYMEVKKRPHYIIAEMSVEN